MCECAAVVAGGYPLFLYRDRDTPKTHAANGFPPHAAPMHGNKGGYQERAIICSSTGVIILFNLHLLLSSRPPVRLLKIAYSVCFCECVSVYPCVSGRSIIFLNTRRISSRHQRVSCLTSGKDKCGVDAWWRGQP